MKEKKTINKKNSGLIKNFLNDNWMFLSIYCVAVLLICTIIFLTIKNNEIFYEKREFLFSTVLDMNIMFISILFTFAFLLKQLFGNRKIGLQLSEKYIKRIVMELLIIFLLIIVEIVLSKKFVYFFFINVYSIVYFILNLIFSSKRTTLIDFIRTQNKFRKSEKNITEIIKIKQNINQFIHMLSDCYQNDDHVSAVLIVKEYRDYCLEVIKKNMHEVIEVSNCNTIDIIEKIGVGFTCCVISDDVDYAKQINQRIINAMIYIYNKLFEYKIDKEIIKRYEINFGNAFLRSALYNYEKTFINVFISIMCEVDKSELFFSKIKFMENLLQSLSYKKININENIILHLLLELPKETKLYQCLSDEKIYLKIKKYFIIGIFNSLDNNEFRSLLYKYARYLERNKKIDDIVDTIENIYFSPGVYENMNYCILLNFIRDYLENKIIDFDAKKRLNCIYYKISFLSIDTGNYIGDLVLPPQIDFKDEAHYIEQIISKIIHKKNVSLLNDCLERFMEVYDDFNMETSGSLEVLFSINELLSMMVYYAQNINDNLINDVLCDYYKKIFKIISLKKINNNKLYENILDSLVELYEPYEENKICSPLFICIIFELTIDLKIKFDLNIISKLNKQMYDIGLHSIEDGKISVLKNVTNYLGWEMINMINDSMAAQKICEQLDDVKKLLYLTIECNLGGNVADYIATVFITVIPYYNTFEHNKNGDSVSNYVNNHLNEKYLIKYIKKAAKLRSYSLDHWGNLLKSQKYHGEFEKFRKMIDNSYEKIME